MSRFDALIAAVETYQGLAAENYNRIRSLAEEIRSGLCDYIGASDGICVQLVPASGPFEPRSYGDAAFSMPPRGFRQIAPVMFGLAVRVSRSSDWLRVTVTCRKDGDSFRVEIEDGESYTVRLPLSAADSEPLFAHVYGFILGWFTSNIAIYQEGGYGAREIGFDLAGERLSRAKV